CARPVVSGYVYNLNPGTPAERMQLSIESLDASGNVVGQSSTWVLGNVPPGNRAYFTAAAAVPAASYRVQVLSFDWGSRGGSSTCHGGKGDDEELFAAASQGGDDPRPFRPPLGREVRAPLALAVPGLRRYVQSHIVDERTRPDIPTTEVDATRK